MNPEQEQVKSWMLAFGQSAPDKPTIPPDDVLLLRARIMLEETLETIRAMGVGISANQAGYSVHLTFDKTAFCFSIDGPCNPLKVLDGIEDTKVVTYGTAVAFGFNDPGSFQEVMRSNWSKMWITEEIAERNPLHLTGDQSTTVYIMDGNLTATKYNNIFWLVKDKGGKVVKSPSYSPPRLEGYILPMAPS